MSSAEEVTKQDATAPFSDQAQSVRIPIKSVLRTTKVIQGREKSPLPLANPSAIARDAGDPKKAAGVAQKDKPGTFLQLFHFITRRDVPFLSAAVFFSLAQGAILPLFSLLLGNLTITFAPDKSLEENADLVSQQFLVMIYLGLGVLVCGFSAAMFWNVLSGRQSQTIQVTYFRHLVEQNSGWFDSHKPDELATNFNEQVASFSAAFSIKMHLLVMNFAVVLSGVILAFVQGWLLSVFVVVLSPVMVVGMFLFIRALRRSEQIQSESYSHAGGIAEEGFFFIKTIKGLNGEEHEIKRYMECCSLARKASVKYGYKAGAYWGMSFWSLVTMYALVLTVSSRLVANGWFNDNSGELYNVGVSFTICYSLLYSIFAVSNIGPLVKAMEAAKVAIALILKIVKEDQSEKSGSFGPETLKGAIVFENVSFAYPSNPGVPILKNVSFEIKPGQKAAFVGPSGSGKSTIVQLLERFYDPIEGRILLDGVDLREYDLHYLRTRIGIVSQQPILFAETIKRNILKGCPNAWEIKDDQIWETLRTVSAEDFVRKLSRGLQQYVGSQGGQLSGGQKQRLAIARAILRKPCLFLFDEATSALDRKNERDIQATLDKVAQGKTSVTIAHRLSTVINSDVIFVLQNGELMSRGTHTELNRKKIMTRSRMTNPKFHRTTCHPKPTRFYRPRHGAPEEQDLAAPSPHSI